MKRIAVLALQGDFEAHRKAFLDAGGLPFEARTLQDIDAGVALAMPGGESTTMLRLLQRFGLFEGLVERIKSGLPVLATCAGLILLAKHVMGEAPGNLGLLDVSIERNAYGRQIASFHTTLTIEFPHPQDITGVFIRAPKILEAGPSVEVISRYQGLPVLVRQGSIVGATFHPELSGSTVIHRWFLDSLVL